MHQHQPIEKLELKDAQKEQPKLFRHIICPSCTEAVSSDNLNLENNVAKCGSCHAIFSIKEEVKSLHVDNESKQEFFRPEGIDLFYYKDEMDITIDQHVQGIDLYGLCFVPLIALFSLLIYFFSDKNISYLIPLLSSLGTIYFVYKAMTASRNKSYITVTDKQLTLRSRPKNLKKDRSYHADEIDQFYLTHSNEMPGWFKINMVINTLDGQKHEKLMTVNSLSKAKYLEQEMERYLNIEDRKVIEETA